MKAEKREIYRILATETIPFGLCTFCSYSISHCCHSGFSECTHTIVKDKEEVVINAFELGDCWGFRPKMPLAIIADTVGMILREGWEYISLWLDNGDWRIAGSKDI